MKIYALKEINTGLYYSRRIKDISELSLDTLFFRTKHDAYKFKKRKLNEIPEACWYTTLSAIEKMYDKPIIEVDLTEGLIFDTASLFKFKVVQINVNEAKYVE